MYNENSPYATTRLSHSQRTTKPRQPQGGPIRSGPVPIDPADTGVHDKPIFEAPTPPEALVDADSFEEVDDTLRSITSHPSILETSRFQHSNQQRILYNIDVNHPIFKISTLHSFLFFFQKYSWN